jgi:hypothetical protein
MSILNSIPIGCNFIQLMIKFLPIVLESDLKYILYITMLFINLLIQNIILILQFSNFMNQTLFFIKKFFLLLFN